MKIYRRTQTFNNSYPVLIRKSITLENKKGKLLFSFYREYIKNKLIRKGYYIKYLTEYINSLKNEDKNKKSNKM